MVTCSQPWERDRHFLGFLERKGLFKQTGSERVAAS
jgi:hypothetical protein